MSERSGAEPRAARGTLSVLVPVFNEESGIGAALAALSAEPRLRGAQVIVIDDGSHDHSAEIAGSCPGVTLLRHERNRGYGAAIKTGLRAASGDFVAWYDADGQHRPQDLADMVCRIEDESLDAVLGARSRESYAVRERLLGKVVLKLVAQGIVGRTIPDVNCGLRVFRRDVLERYLHLLPDGFSASTTTTLLMLKRHYRVAFHAVLAPRRAGQSSVRQLRDGLSTLHLIARVVMLFNAFRAFSAIAAVIGVTGLVYGTVVALTHKLGFPVLAALMVIVALQIFLMGLIGDQISAMRIERLEDGARVRESASGNRGGPVGDR